MPGFIAQWVAGLTANSGGFGGVGGGVGLPVQILALPHNFMIMISFLQSFSPFR